MKKRAAGEQKALVGNAGDEQQVKKAGDREKFREEERQNDLRYVLAHPRGRRFLWELMSGCRIYEADLIVDHGCNQYRNGERNIGVRLLNEIIKCDLDSFLIMQKEAYERKEKGDA